MTDGGHRLNGSVVKAWFQYRCERKTRYELLTPRARAANRVVSDHRDQSEWARIGQDYEQRVVQSLGGAVLRPEADQQSLLDSVTVSFLRGAGGERYAYQANLRPDVFPPELALPAGVGLGPTLADLVERSTTGGETTFTLIDIKATRRPTTFHKTQVAFYAILLSARLRETGIAGKVSETGLIWHVPEGGDIGGDGFQVDSFVLAPYERMVLAFCERDLPRIMAAELTPSVDRTFFHLYFKCEECGFRRAQCSPAIDASKPPAERDVSAVAGLTHEAKANLLRHGILTVADLARAADVADRPGIAWSLRRRMDLLLQRARSIQDSVPQRTAERYSMLMPPRVDVAVHLAADFDPVGDRLATLACQVVRGETVVRSVVRVMPTSRRADEADALVAVFGAVIGELAAVDAHNRRGGLATADALRAHLFVYEASEATAIQGAVARHLSDTRVRQGLLDMVRLFPPEEVIPEPEYRGADHLPATAVRSVVEHLYALPVMVSYDLARVSQAIAGIGGIGVPYAPVEPFARPFSSLLSIEVIRRVERRGDDALAARVGADVVDRLATLRALVRWLMDQSRAQAAGPWGPMLRLEKRPFRFWDTFDPLDVGDLDVLQAIELIEHRGGMLARLVELARPVERRADTGRCVSGLRFLGAHRGGTPRLVFERPPEARDADLGPDSFGLVLTDDDQGVLLDPGRWDEVACRIERDRPRSDPGQVVVTMRANAFDSNTFQRMMRRSADGGLWTIDLVHKDVNTDRVVAFLRHVAMEANS